MSEPEHPVLTELKRRQAGLSGQYRLALAVEGGGLRGVISAGMLHAMQDLQLFPHLFDEIYGASAGALNAVLYLAGQPAAAIPLYMNAAINKGFKNPLRALVGRPIVDLDYLIDNILDHWPSFDPDPVLQAKLLRVVATSIDNATVVAFPPPRTWQELASYLKASASIPLVAGPPKVVDGERFLDASVGEAIPWETPIAEGYEHILVLSTRGLGVPKVNGVMRRLVDLMWMRRYGPDLHALALHRRNSRAERARMLADLTSNPTSPPYVFTVAPNVQADAISPLESDPSAVYSAGLLGFNAVREVMDLPKLDQVPSIHPPQQIRGRTPANSPVEQG